MQYSSGVGATGSLGGSMANAAVSGSVEPTSSRIVVSVTPGPQPQRLHCFVARTLYLTREIL